MEEEIFLSLVVDEKGIQRELAEYEQYLRKGGINEIALMRMDGECEQFHCPICRTPIYKIYNRMEEEFLAKVEAEKNPLPLKWQDPQAVVDGAMRTIEKEIDYMKKEEIAASKRSYVPKDS